MVAVASILVDAVPNRGYCFWLRWRKMIHNEPAGNLQERNELVDDAVNKMRKLMEKWKDRLTLDNLRLAERYVKGDLEILIHFRSQGAGDPTEYCAVLKYSEFPAGVKRAGFANHDKPGLRGWRPLREHYTGILDITSRHEQEAMFVGIVEIVENPKARVPTSVRLDTLDKTYGNRTHSLYLSLKGFFFFGRSRGSFEDGEISVSAGVLSVALDQLPSQVVEAAPQLMDSFSGDQAKVKGWGGVDPDLISVSGWFQRGPRCTC